MNTFVLLAMGTALLGAMLAVGLSNILYAIFGLGLALLGVAGLFLSLGSPFVAAMQILIYVGGITVAMVFAVMLSFAMGAKTTGEPGLWTRLGALIPVGILAAAVGLGIRNEGLDAVVLDVTEALPIADMGMALLQQFNLVFETLSVVLLLAIVGAVTIARQPPEEDA